MVSTNSKCYDQVRRTNLEAQCKNGGMFPTHSCLEAVSRVAGKGCFEDSSFITYLGSFRRCDDHSFLPSVA